MSAVLKPNALRWKRFPIGLSPRKPEGYYCKAVVYPFVLIVEDGGAWQLELPDGCGDEIIRRKAPTAAAGKVQAIAAARKILERALGQLGGVA